MPLIDLFDRAASRWPDRPFLIDGDRCWTHQQAAEMSRHIAGALHAAGADIGTPTAVWSPNCGLGFLAMIGTFRSGAAWVPIQAKNTIDANLDYLRYVGTELLFVHSDVVDDVLARRAELPDVHTIVCIDDKRDGAPDLESWADASLSVDTPPLAAEDLFALLGTGGTTGRPKAAMLTQAGLETEAANFLVAMPPGDHPVNLLATPMTHGSGFTAFPLLGSGATHVVIPRATSAAVFDAIDTHTVTHVFLPPTVIYDMLADPARHDHDVSCLRNLIYAAAPMSVDKLREAIDLFGPVMTQVYGQSEAPLMCTYLAPEDHVLDGPESKRLASCGRPTMFTGITILDDDHQPVPIGTPGEVALTGQLVMAGYHREPEATRASRAGRWHLTGDIGYLDDDGFLYLVDRKNDMIISGGFNVYPSEVEQALWAHPSVQDCAVVGAPHTRWGEQVVAVVQLKPQTEAETDELIRFAKDHVGSVKAPKHVQIWDDLPRSAVGKVMRRAVRDTFWQSKERQI